MELQIIVQSKPVVACKQISMYISAGAEWPEMSTGKRTYRNLCSYLKIINSLSIFIYVTEKLTVGHCFWSYTQSQTAPSQNRSKIVVVRMRTMPKFVLKPAGAYFYRYFDAFLQVLDKFLCVATGYILAKPVVKKNK